MKIIVVISGFTQKRFQNTGSRQLWRKLCIERDMCRCSNTFVDFREWDSDWSSYARFINSMNPSEVLICCYSWGAGYGMPQLAKRLKCNVEVVACDPVYRSPTPLGRWMAFSDHEIKIPKNVSIVGWVGQVDKWYKLDGDTFEGGRSICKQQILDYNHTEIDNSPEYHKLAVLKAKEYLH
jgi:hypothetical protein